MRFSATDAAFEGFRLTRQHPGAVVLWAAVILAANLISGLAISLIAGPDWNAFETAAAAAAPDPNQLAAYLPKVGLASLCSVLVQIVGAGVVNASVLRSLLRPSEGARLAFGRDELRVIGLFAAFVVVSFVASMAPGLLLGLLSAAGANPALLGLLSTLIGVLVSLILAVRFSLAGPMTVAEHQFRFRPSWPVTRPWFWPLLGAECLAAIFAAMVAILAYVVFLALAGAVVIGRGGAITDLAGVFSLDFGSPARMLAPGPLIYIGFLSLLYALALAILIAPPVELYRALQAEKSRAPVAPNWPRLD